MLSVVINSKQSFHMSKVARSGRVNSAATLRCSVLFLNGKYLSNVTDVVYSAT